MQAEALYGQQFERRAPYMLKAKGQMSQDGTRRYLMPEPLKENNLLETPHRYKQKTVMMKLPTDVDPTDKNLAGSSTSSITPGAANTGARHTGCATASSQSTAT